MTTPYTSDELAVMLRRQAAGYAPDEAAVELLIAHDVWLRRSDFVARFVGVETDPDIVGDTPLAWIEWAKVTEAFTARRIHGSSSERTVLQVAANLGHLDAPLSLRDQVPSLAIHNLSTVLHAIGHAAGHPIREVFYQ